MQVATAIRRVNRRDLLETREAALDGAQEALLLGARRVDEMLPSREQLRIDITHVRRDLVDDMVKRRSATAQQPRMAHRTTQDAPQHIPTALVRGKDTVRQKERHRARMLCEHTKRRRRCAVGQFAGRARSGALDSLRPIGIWKADDLLDLRDERHEHVRVIVARYALQRRGGALESKTCIHGRFW